MTKIKTMPMLIPCGDLFITKMMTTSGTKVPVVLIKQAYILCKEHLETTMFCLLMMRVGIVQLDNGK